MSPASDPSNSVSFAGLSFFLVVSPYNSTNALLINVPVAPESIMAHISTGRSLFWVILQSKIMCCGPLILKSTLAKRSAVSFVRQVLFPRPLLGLSSRLSLTLIDWVILHLHILHRVVRSGSKLCLRHSLTHSGCLELLDLQLVLVPP